MLWFERIFIHFLMVGFQESIAATNSLRRWIAFVGFTFIVVEHLLQVVDVAIDSGETPRQSRLVTDPTWSRLVHLISISTRLTLRIDYQKTIHIFRLAFDELFVLGSFR